MAAGEVQSLGDELAAATPEAIQSIVAMLVMRTRSHGTRESRDGPDEVARAPPCRLITRRPAKMEQTGEILPQTGQSGQTTATSEVDRCSETSWSGRGAEISMPSRH